MNRQQKEGLVELLRQEFTDAQASFIVDYKGLTVGNLHTLRKQLREQNGTFRIAKGVDGVDELLQYIHGQIGLVFAADDVAAVAKALHTFVQANEKMTLLAGFVDARVLNAQNVVRIASLPSKDVMLAQVCGTMKAPITNFVGILNMLILRLLFVDVL